MNAVLLIPTLNRISLLKEFIKSYKETESIIETWLLVDSADLGLNRDGYGEIRELLPSTMQIVETGLDVSMGDKVRSIWPILRGKKLKWVGLLNDDHYCLTKHWDKIADEILNGRNMLSTNDGYWNFGINPVGLTAWSWDLLEASGIPIFPGKLQHWYIDDLWKQIGDKSGAWVETMKINIAHNHVFKGAMAQDETFKKIQNETQISLSKREFDQFMAQDFERVVKRILELRAQEILESKHL